MFTLSLNETTHAAGGLLLSASERFSLCLLHRTNKMSKVSGRACSFIVQTIRPTGQNTH